MTRGARDRATERDASRGPGRAVSRVGLALGVSVVLHGLGGVALWWGVPAPRPEPERSRPVGSLEVELVWRTASGSDGAGGTAGPEVREPARAPERVSRPALVGRGHARVTDTSRAGERPPAPRAEAAEPPPTVRAEVTPPPSEPSSEPPLEPEAPGVAAGAGGLAETPALAAPGGAGEGVAGSGGGQVEEARGGGAAGAVSPGGGGGVDAELRAYGERLSRHITRQRRYPAQAVRLGMEGTALVRVRINRDGSLGAPPRLEGSSRFRVLDAEALRMVEAAAPFSPLPAGLPRDSAELVIPVRFSLRDAAG
jgi:TonB family protein